MTNNHHCLTDFQTIILTTPPLCGGDFYCYLRLVSTGSNFLIEPCVHDLLSLRDIISLVVVIQTLALESADYALNKWLVFRRLWPRPVRGTQTKLCFVCVPRLPLPSRDIPLPCPYFANASKTRCRCRVVVRYLDVFSEPRDDFSRRASAIHGEMAQPRRK
jgi:hypothetical protein